MTVLELPLGQKIFYHLEQAYTTMSFEHQQVLKRFFHYGDLRSFGVGPYEVLPVVQQWLNGSELQNQVLEQPGNQLATVFAPMLVWALHQPWASEIHVEKALRKWRVVATDEQSIAAQGKHAAVLANMLADVLPLFPATTLPGTCTHLYHALDSVVSIFAPTQARMHRLSAKALTEVTIGLGHLASMAPTECGPEGIALQDRWEHRWTPLWNNLTYSQNNESICAVLDSSLPDAQKWRAMAYTLPGHWEQEIIAEKMKKLFWPATEYEMAMVLPWMDCPREPDEAFGAEQQHAIDSNRMLLLRYCPSLVDNIRLLATDDDWCSAQQMRVLTELSKPRQSIEVFPLPNENPEP